MKTQQNISRSCLFAILLAGFCHTSAYAQQDDPVLVTNAPSFGTFYWLSGLPPAPYPFDPAHGLLKIYSFNGAYYVDDTALLLNLDGGGMMLMGSPSPPGGGGGSTNPVVCNSPTNFVITYASATNTNTWVSIWLTATNVNLRINTTNMGNLYDLYATTNMAPLALPQWSKTNWTLFAHASNATIYLSWGQTNWCEAYFQTGDLTDSDGDGLTDAYENLVSHTDKDNRDTDGDGILDGVEVQYSLNPKVADPAFTITITQPSGDSLLP